MTRIKWMRQSAPSVPSAAELGFFSVMPDCVHGIDASGAPGR